MLEVIICILVVILFIWYNVKGIIDIIKEIVTDHPVFCVILLLVFGCFILYKIIGWKIKFPKKHSKQKNHCHIERDSDWEPRNSPSSCNGDNYYDAQGYLRGPNDSYYDSAGILRGPKDNFFDSEGILRSPGDNYYDSKGYLRGPDENYYDSEGYLRDPGDRYH